MSATCARAASRSRGASRRAASDFTTITESVWPRRSWRSRENRSRSFSTAVRASSSRVARSSRTVSFRARIAAVTITEMNVPYTTPNESQPSRQNVTAATPATSGKVIRDSSLPRRTTAPTARPRSGKSSSHSRP